MLWGCSATAMAQPLTCHQLLNHPTVEAAVQASGSAFQVIDLSRRQLSRTGHQSDAQQRAISDSFVHYRNSDLTLRVLALDLPTNAPLVEVTCAIGRRLRLDVDETLIVITSFGMHAYSGSLTYHQLRLLARRHNTHLGRTPLSASARYATDILHHIEHQRGALNRLALLSLVSFLLGAILLMLLLRTPLAPLPEPGPIR
ncbi:MAG: hypothetical protein AAFS10_00785 [Myxococcota bacterium]